MTSCASPRAPTTTSSSSSTSRCRAGKAEARRPGTTDAIARLMSQADTPPTPQPAQTRTIEANLGQLTAHATRHGTMLAPPQDAYVGRSLELYGEYCRAETDAL